MRLLLGLLLLSFISGPFVYSQQPDKRAKKSAKPCPGVHAIADCPEDGCGKDRDRKLNELKNIPSDPGTAPVLQSIQWMKDLPDPLHFTAKKRGRDELKELGEGQKITVVAWALAARKGGKESCNCKLSAKADTDNHIVLVDPSLKDPTLDKNEKRDSETAEFTPRFRVTHPRLTQEDLESLIDPDWSPGETPKKGKLLVRVTGLLLFDSEHFLKNPLRRHNNWEIHPVFKMEYCPEDEECQPDSDAGWKDLESE